MGTRSNIAVINSAGTISAIYCHWDGYVSHNGAILQQHYTTQEQVEELIALGDLSALRSEVGKKHSFDNPANGWCIAYGRDRGETNIDADTFDNAQDWIRTHGEEYNYIFINGVWYVNDHCDEDISGVPIFTDLATALLMAAIEE